MRVAIDEQIFLLQTRGGISRYFAELIARLPKVEPPVDVFTPFRRVANRHLLDAAPEGRFKPLKGPMQPYLDLATAATRPRRRAEVALVHHTFYHPRFLRDYPRLPKVVTIYDMIPEITGAKGRFGDPHMAKREYVRRADLLLFISHSAYEDLVAAYGEPAAPCIITHLGVDDAFRHGGPLPAGLPGDYVLYVGNRSGYKDFSTLLHSFAAAGSALADLAIVCVGGGGFTADEAAAIESLQLSGRVHQRTLSDAEMPGAYANARAFVFPSRYEGFGLPAVEAFAAGTPAVLADTSSLPEVGGDAAVYFEPGNAEQLADVLTGLMADTGLRERLIAAGRERAEQFTWSRTAQQTADAYRTVAQ